MATRREQLDARPRRAFTLLEVLLTLGVLVILAGFGLPALERLRVSSRLTNAADQVRARWSGARAMAIESGRLIFFRYLPGGDRYRIDCQADSLGDDDGLPACLARLPLEQTLPDGVRFSADQAQAPRANEGSDEPLAELIDTGQNWSQPIQFCPDGTCSNADLQLRNDADWTVQLTLRGMTGVVSVGRPQPPQSGSRIDPSKETGP